MFIQYLRLSQDNPYIIVYGQLSEDRERITEAEQKMGKKIEVTISLAPRTIKWLDNAAKSVHMSRKAYIETALEQAPPIMPHMENLLRVLQRRIFYAKEGKSKRKNSY